MAYKVEVSALEKRASTSFDKVLECVLRQSQRMKPEEIEKLLLDDYVPMCFATLNEDNESLWGAISRSIVSNNLGVLQILKQQAKINGKQQEM